MSGELIDEKILDFVIKNDTQDMPSCWDELYAYARHIVRAYVDHKATNEPDEAKASEQPVDMSLVECVATAIQKEIWGKRSLDDMGLIGITHKRISHEAARVAIACMPMRESGKQWQPIGTAPKDGTRILLATKWGVLQAYWHQPANPNFAGNWMCFGSHQTKKPTGWMPLPEIEDEASK